MTRTRAHAIVQDHRQEGLGMDTEGFKANSKLIGIAVACALGFIFILQNFEQTSFQFLFWTLLSAPKWIVVGSTFAIGLAFGYLLGKKKA